MEVAVAVPAGTAADDVAVSLVGQRSLAVRVGERSLSVQLPAPGDPGACQAELRGAGLHITVGALQPAATLEGIHTVGMRASAGCSASVTGMASVAAFGEDASEWNQ